ncbi:hypothetical protein VX037_22735 [Gordonia sp. Z-3]|uniref:hypothetical protein n=1 Tax=Gordonia sp. Z-3 TaxID=3115408 RepID=UPI002E2AAC4D|nr:hypothetical protein [Gordonia sp. Z-3]MED5803848.1 hypothetical protein [Gordonia sp. Z-3]
MLRSVVSQPSRRQWLCGAAGLMVVMMVGLLAVLPHHGSTAADPAPETVSPSRSAAASTQPQTSDSALDAVESTPGYDPADVEVAILDRDADHLALNPSGSAPMLSASLVKLLVAIDIVDRRRDNGLVVGARDLQLISRGSPTVTTSR